MSNSHSKYPDIRIRFFQNRIIRYPASNSVSGTTLIFNWTKQYLCNRPLNGQFIQLLQPRNSINFLNCYLMHAPRPSVSDPDPKHCFFNLFFSFFNIFFHFFPFPPLFPPFFFFLFIFPPKDGLSFKRYKKLLSRISIPRIRIRYLFLGRIRIR